MSSNAWIMGQSGQNVLSVLKTVLHVSSCTLLNQIEGLINAPHSDMIKHLKNSFCINKGCYVPEVFMC